MNWNYFIETSFQDVITNFISLLNPSWQQVLLSIALFFIIMFKANISDLLSKVRQISKEGVIFESQKNAPITATPDEELKKNDRLFRGVTEIETISYNVDVIQEELKKVPTEQEKIRNLTNYLAELFFILRCERVYNNIFGSQIALLEKLSKELDLGISLHKIEQYVDGIPALVAMYDGFPGNRIEHYLFFLKTSLLITEKDNIFHITKFGMDFLTWLQRSSLRTDKPF